MSKTPFKNLRKQIKATQRVIADRTGKTVATVWNWENCVYAPPLSDADDLATAYETSREQIEKAIVATARLVGKQPVKAGRA